MKAEDITTPLLQARAVRSDETLAFHITSSEDPPDPVWEKPSTVRVGATAETIAAEFLIARGYRIIERNFRCKIGELDVVARDAEGTLCFIEVRSRKNHSYGNAAETVNQTKQRKVTRAAKAYLFFRKPEFDTARFDVVAITGDQID